VNNSIDILVISNILIEAFNSLRLAYKE